MHTNPLVVTAKLNFVRRLKETIARSYQSFIVVVHVAFEASIERFMPPERSE